MQVGHAEVKPIRVGEVELYYAEAGRGEAVVCVHGGLGDLTYWDDQLPAFARRWRAVTYSRRYCWPNSNLQFDPAYSPLTDSHDLENLIAALDLGPVHVVAASVGGCAALFLAVRRPDLIRTLTLAEPPMLRWARATPEGEADWQAWIANVWQPAAAAFEAGEFPTAVAYFIDAFLGPGGFAQLPPKVQGRITRNARDLEAQVLSSDPFPELPIEQVAQITVPVLLLSGGRSRRPHNIIDAMLADRLPRVERIIVPKASHDVWVDAPVACLDATVEHLTGVG
jgi:pimeloyl-ACP methyl ester carboxylesterase